MVFRAEGSLGGYVPILAEGYVILELIIMKEFRHNSQGNKSVTYLDVENLIRQCC